jgi:hypothetical protein
VYEREREREGERERERGETVRRDREETEFLSTVALLKLCVAD